jgi:SAM-dependent methyltransferase
MSPTDHFSRQAAQYRASRPSYPAELFAFLADVAPARNLALDCATGNGQAALGLAEHFARVLGTDLSPAQLAHRAFHPRVDYVAATAERLPVADGAVDVVTVAQALHWLDLPRFYAEVRRVARPGGIIAAWSYGRLEVAPAIDTVVEHLYADVVGPYWPAERALVESGYRDLPFPFQPLPAPPFALQAEWPLARLLGYLSSWSAVQRCKDATGSDPLATVTEPLAAAWGDPGASRTVRWPLALRLGRACVVARSSI